MFRLVIEMILILSESPRLQSWDDRLFVLVEKVIYNMHSGSLN